MRALLCVLLGVVVLDLGVLLFGVGLYATLYATEAWQVESGIFALILSSPCFLATYEMLHYQRKGKN